MAKLRIFVSSTYYDLKHIRNYLEAFIDSFGYEPVLFESGDIPFEHDKPLDESCYKEILNSQMQILIIGGRYGSEESKAKVQPKAKKPSKKSEETADEKHRRYNSITKMEYKAALEQNIPVFIFVEKQVLAEYDTYRNNRDNDSIQYAHVDSINVFRLIDDIYSQAVGNFIRGFEKFEDISNWLRDQWSGMFADFLKKNKDRIEIESISAKIDELSAVSNALKKYSELLLKDALPNESEAIIEEEDKRFIEKMKVDFINHPLINHIYGISGVDFDNEFVINSFKRSDSLAGFLKRLRLDEDIIESILLRNIAQRDFNILKNRYQEYLL